MTDKTARLSRRSFLFTLGAGGAATAAVVATRSAQQGAADAKPKARTSASYQESAHIRNYYRTTKV
ncbi:MAG TPA: formate dehydrogenase [Burkholderiales bacterium]|nr:formate dehydrogenase [Burkholderiales bacterium]